MVSVLIAAYGRLPFLKLAVTSALSQDYPEFEVLVIDDGSDAETQEWLRHTQAQNSERLRVIFQNHQGVAEARARGVRESRGEYVCILDSDDILLPRALRTLVGAITKDAGTTLVHTNIREMRPNGAVVVQEYPRYHNAHAMLLSTLIKPRVPFKHSGTLFHRQTAIKLGSYNPELPCKVDIDFYLKFLQAGHLPRLVSEPLVEFRMHKNSVSRNRLLGIRIWFRLIDLYGPSNPMLRFFIKILRGSAEIFKQIYIELKG